MKKIAKILIAAVVGIIVITTAVYAYYGGFSSVEFEVKESGGEVFVYENVTGSYKQSPAVMDSIYYALINDLKIETTKGAGIYYDNPHDVEESKLRSDVGCLLNEMPDSTQMAKLSERFKVVVLPKGNYIESDFKNKGTLSIFVGIIKVYPALDKFMTEKGYKKEGPVMEIYDQPTKTITYRKEAIK